MSNLHTKNINVSLDGGYISEAFRKEGRSMTIVAEFEDVSGSPVVKLQQSVEGRVFQDIPKSAVELEDGQEQQMWNDSILPEGTFIHVVVCKPSGDVEPARRGLLSTIKILS